MRSSPFARELQAVFMDRDSFLGWSWRLGRRENFAVWGGGGRVSPCGARSFPSGRIVK